MKITDKELKAILINGSYVQEEDIKNAEKYATSHRSNFINYLLNEELLTKSIIGQAVAEYIKVPYFDLKANEPQGEQVMEIPEEIARKLGVIIVKKDKAQLTIATDDPKQEGIAQTLNKLFPKQKIIIVFSLKEDIENCFRYYHKNLEVRFQKVIESGEHIAPQILEAIFEDAMSLHVSDIHFEPTENDVLLRFRLDGVLFDAARIPRDQYENVLNRIKVESGIRLDEHFAAQDGAMQFKKNGMTIDLRVSIVPTVQGEKIVIRLLSSYVQGLNLGELGLSEKDYALLEESAKRPFGMIVVIGPTGSGKTTTLYGALKILNHSGVNITTIEDPVEYKMKGLNQIQVNALTNLTFAKGLRSIVRQDPDVILVGEIRDQETAEIAVNAALTGHLLLSTFHANDAATAIPRLLDMGVEPFLLASTLNLLIAQRLARKICQHCRTSFTTAPSEINKGNKNLSRFFTGRKISLYKGKGCDACGQSGYKGRTAIFELIAVTPELQNLILKHPSSQEIWKIARSQGAQTLFEDGIEKVKNGVTTLDELLRVAEPPKLT